eukprot:gnl/Chilomastix_cuspidata/1764.p2 GENE.gnl/Chilomastix_cuspidata/1764~~gnl/Chilomastix_cuspidata/1764.p2  ORF type:complete len:178 (+),score=83.16 gnl/Chilomastix_cuspidata/1764:33-536(+)
MDYPGGYKRQSILRRPRKQPSEKNRTTFDDEFQREQHRLSVLTEKRQAREYERLRAMYGSMEDKRQMQEELRAAIDKLVEERERMKREEIAEEEKITHEMLEQAEFAHFVEQDHQQARLEYERYLLEENRRLEEERRQAQQLARQHGIMEDHERPDFFEEAFMRSYR